MWKKSISNNSVFIHRTTNHTTAATHIPSLSVSSSSFFLNRRRPFIIMTNNPNNNNTNPKRIHQQSFSSSSSSSSSNDRTNPTATGSPIGWLLKPWDQPMIVCTGDYRNERWLEHHHNNTNNTNKESSSSPLYQYQSTLPQLPVPDIESTMKRLVSTVVPLGRNETELQKFAQAVEMFPQQAHHLQQRLLQRAQDASNTNTSWLQVWWNTLGYLQVRDSIVINVSYYFHFQDDPTIHTSSSTHNRTIIPPNVKRAACMIYGLSLFRRQVCTGQLPAEQMGKGERRTPLCSTAYKYMFHSTRIPQIDQDVYHLYDPSQNNHCTIVRYGKYYTMEFCDAITGIPYSIDTIQKQIQTILTMAELEKKEWNDCEFPIGYCTGINRDHWATLRNAFIEQDPVMKQELEKIESSAFVICLDDTEPVSRTEMGEILLHGNVNVNKDDDSDKDTISSSTSSSPNTIIGQGYNRWYDKSIQLVVTNNGKCGFIGEHSMMDGMPLVNLANAITSLSYGKLVSQQQQQDEVETKPKQPIQKVFANAYITKLLSNQSIHQLIQQAKIEYTHHVQQNSLLVQSFQGYGSTYMKQMGYSPDAYVQMIMQLATYRLFGEHKQVGTYESTQVRPFVHGRTETTRTVSKESCEFVQLFGGGQSNNNATTTSLEDNKELVLKKVQVFQTAIDAHVKYINNAAKGYGVDRHLFGMSMLVEDKEPIPDLYNDPLYLRAKRWRVSTSHLTHPKFDGWGYGQVVPDGVGLAYSIHTNHCVFTITALKHTGYTHQLSHLLEEALLEVRTTLQLYHQYNQNKNPTSKL